MAPSHPAGPNRSILFEKWMETTKLKLTRTTGFPKNLRHTLTERIDLLAIGILEDVTTAAYQKNPQKSLESANDKLNRLRVLLRLAHEMAVLSHDQYRELSNAIAESGRLLGGWMKKGIDQDELPAGF